MNKMTGCGDVTLILRAYSVILSSESCGMHFGGRYSESVSQEQMSLRPQGLSQGDYSTEDEIFR